jgi:hypothetical protein
VGVHRAPDTSIAVADGNDLEGPFGTQGLYQLRDTRQLWIHHNDIDFQIQIAGERISLPGIQSGHDLTACLTKHLAQPPDKAQVLINDEDNWGT